MGLTITADYKGAPRWDMGHASFFRLRRDVAYAVSEEFGDHYAAITKPTYSMYIGMMQEYDRETDRLVRKYRLGKRFMDFLYAPDIGYMLSPAKCKAVLEKLANRPHPERNNRYGYMAWYLDFVRLGTEKPDGV